MTLAGNYVGAQIYHAYVQLRIAPPIRDSRSPMVVKAYGVLRLNLLEQLLDLGCVWARSAHNQGVSNLWEMGSTVVESVDPGTRALALAV